MSEVKGIPFDAPLYQRDTEHGSSFLNCQSVNAVFTIGSDVSHLLPKGLVPAADRPLGIVTTARYGFSNVGPYLEYYSGIQARDAK